MADFDVNLQLLLEKVDELNSVDRSTLEPIAQRLPALATTIASAMEGQGADGWKAKAQQDSGLYENIKSVLTDINARAAEVQNIYAQGNARGGSLF